jgi:hypothetical protein
VEQPDADFEKAFWDQGYAVVEGFFSPGELAAVQESVLSHYRTMPLMDWPENFKEFETFTDPWTPGPPERGFFETLSRNSRLANLTRRLLGPDFSDQGCLVMQTRPGTGQAWHQDTRCLNASHFILNRILYPWIYPPEAGGIILLPGSHRLGRIPGGSNHDPMKGETALFPKAGSLVFLHSFTYHRVGINRWTGARHSLNFRARPASCPENYDRVGVYRNADYDFRTQSPVKG